MLPGVDGLSVLRAMRVTRPDTPVLILSARSELPTKLRGFELGATDYLTKPFALEEFLARVRVQLQRAETMSRADPDGRSSSTSCAGGCASRRRRRDLSEREFTLLRASSTTAARS